MPHGWKVAASCRGGQKHTTHSDIKYIHLLFRPGKPQLGKFPTNFHSVLVFWATFLWRVSYCFFPLLPPSHSWPFYPYQPKFRVHHLCTEQAIKYSAAQRWVSVLWAHGFFFVSTDSWSRGCFHFGSHLNGNLLCQHQNQALNGCLSFRLDCCNSTREKRVKSQKSSLSRWLFNSSVWLNNPSWNPC